MSKKVIIGMVFGGFVAGIVATSLFLRTFILPDMAEEIGVFAVESAVRAYNCGYADGEESIYDLPIDEETLEFVANYEYKFIK